MNSADPDRQLGEYQLLELLDETALCRKWLARQISVSRVALVDELKLEDQRSKFLADVRAKASVDHPSVASVYEAVASPELCFFAYELLPGVTLKARRDSAESLAPIRLVHVLKRVAEANLQYEALGHATTLLDLDSIFLDEHDVVRLANLAVAGPRDTTQSVRDISHLGVVLTDLIPSEQAGTNRMLTLCAWMRGEGLEQAISWSQIREFCDQIEQQFAEATATLPLTSGSHLDRAKWMRRWLPIVAIALALIALAVALTLCRRPTVTGPPPRLKLPAAVRIEAGDYPTSEGKSVRLPAFRIAAHPVTIDEYAEFIENLARLTESRRQQTFDSENQPPSKLNHTPNDWETLYAAAKANGSWHGRTVTLDSPVIGVDWWDAAAYAEWKKARLPSQEEWFAAMQKITSATAHPVQEWTLRLASNPANSLGERMWVLVSNTTQPTKNHGFTRQWISDRTSRADDLSFRLVFEEP